MNGKSLIELMDKDKQLSKELIDKLNKEINEISNKFIDDLQKLLAREGE